ncbi:MAG: hypothetical protein AAGH57_10425 [Pseudomonadota bacterium]
MKDLQAYKKNERVEVLQGGEDWQPGYVKQVYIEELGYLVAMLDIGVERYVSERSNIREESSRQSATPVQLMTQGEGAESHALRGQLVTWVTIGGKRLALVEMDDDDEGEGDPVDTIA